MFNDNNTGRTRRILSRLILLTVLTLIGAGTALTTFGQSHQLSLADILIALRSKKADLGEKNDILAAAVKDRGITFNLTPEIEKELGNTGAAPELIDAIKQKTTPPAVAEIKKADPPKVETQTPPAPKPTPAPPDFAFYQNRAAAAFTKGDLDAAVTDYGHALELKPTDSRTYLDRAIALVKQDKREAAMADVNRSIELDGKYAPAYVCRAQLNEKSGAIANAIADYEKAFDLDPIYADAKTSAARLREQQAKAAAPPPESVKPPVSAPAEPKLVSVGAMNAYASNLAMPVYSSHDRNMGLQGRVTVQLVIDENGKLVSVEATDGPKQLRIAAEDAVKRSKFKPVVIGGAAIKASGFIVYNFVPNQ